MLTYVMFIIGLGLDICLTGYPALVLGQKGTIYPAKPDIPFDMDIRPKIGRLSDICAGYPALSRYFRPDPEFDFQPDIQSNIQLKRQDMLHCNALC